MTIEPDAVTSTRPNATSETKQCKVEDTAPNEPSTSAGADNEQNENSIGDDNESDVDFFDGTADFDGSWDERCDCHVDYQGFSDKIPYTSIYDPLHKSNNRCYFIPGLPIKAKIVGSEREAGVHLFSTYIYTIRLQHGDFEWEIKRQYGDFYHLHNCLRLYRTTERLKYPVRRIEKLVADVVENVGEVFSDSSPLDLDAGTAITTVAPGSPVAGAAIAQRNLGSPLGDEGVDQPDRASSVPRVLTPKSPARRAHSTRSLGPIAPLELDSYYKSSSAAKPESAIGPVVHEVAAEEAVVFGQHHGYSNLPKKSEGPPGSNNNDYSALPKGAQLHCIAPSQSGLMDYPDNAVCMMNDHGRLSVENNAPPYHVDDHRVGKKKCCKLPRFPITPEAMLTAPEDLEARKVEIASLTQSRLELYLQKVLHISAYRNHKDAREFLGVSRVSFVHNLGGKYIEGLVKKRPGGRTQFHGLLRWCVEHCSKWSKRWLILKDSYLVYMDPVTEEIRSVLLFDWSFEGAYGASETEGIRHGVRISNLTRELLLKTDEEHDAEAWRSAVTHVTQTRGRIWLEKHRFGSFAPTRFGVHAQWFVDGSSHMEQVANMLELAKEEIFITDWWLSPEVYLKRPVAHGDYWRLDQVLKRKAEAGVNVYVLLYKEVSLALGINSLYSKSLLVKLHPRIKVLRHPDHLPIKASGGVYLWAHHEKLVIVDQMAAFVGGIDLCYGRWDDHVHRLTDLGSVQLAAFPVTVQKKSLAEGMRSVAQLFPAVGVVEQGRPSALTIVPIDESPDRGVIANRNGLATVEEEGKINESSATSLEPPPAAARLSPAAAAKRRRFQGGFRKSVAGVLARHRLARSNSESQHHGQFELPLSESAAGAAKPGKGGRWPLRRHLSVPADGNGDAADEPIDLAEIVQQYKEVVNKHKLLGSLDETAHNDSSVVINLDQESPSRPKRVAATAWKKLIHHKLIHHKEPEKDDDIAQEYEAIWKKIQNLDVCDLAGAAKIWIGKDYANFIFKDFTDLQLPFHDFIDRSATPRMPWHDISSVVYGSAARDVARHFIERWNAAKVEKAKRNDSYPLLLPKSYDNVKVPRVFAQMSHKCNIQVIRSSALWSVGENINEDSIHQAYIHLIATAKHYVYIENQFFVSLLRHGEVSNGICQALCDRIVRAYQDNETFRIYVLLPLLPGFEGQISAGTGSAIQAILHWTYRSISRTPNSLLEYLQGTVDDPKRFIVFCGLRTHDELANTLLTELIYIHSKLIIADDRVCIIGSANINDRSMLGKRDSEVAVYVEDCEFEPSTMNGQPYRSGKFCGSLRKHLFREHLGLLPGQRHPMSTVSVDDPVSENFFNQVWLETARRNTEIYDKVFHCIPTDDVKSFTDFVRFNAQVPLTKVNHLLAEELLSDVKGSLVLFPLEFLSQSDLAPSFKTKEGYAPVSLWT